MIRNVNTAFTKLLSELAKQYKNTPKGEEKNILRRVIDRDGHIIYGTTTIEQIEDYNTDENR